MSLNIKNKQEALQRKADLYAELAKELEEKLSKRNAEIMALRRSNQVLQKECVGHKSKIVNLETQCFARSAKVAQLSDTIAARKSDKVQERLMEKSLEIADLVEENERLKIQKKHLQDENSRNGKILLEMCEIVQLLSQIDIPYNKVENDVENGRYSNMIYPKSRYSDNFLTPSGDLPQDLPMENVQRKVKAMEAAIRERGDLRKENELQKQKLGSLREKNADLNFEINSLETKLRDHQEQSQGWDHSLQQRTMSEASSRTWGNDSDHDSRNTFSTASYSDDSSKDVSLGDFVAENGRTSSEDPSEDTGINDSYRESDTRSQFLFSEVNRSLSTVDELNGDCDDEDSDNTSFSSLEAPPSQDEEDKEGEDEQAKTSSLNEQTARPEEHKQLQNNFEKALDVIEKLKEDLSRSNNANSAGISRNRDFDDTSTDVGRLEHELEEAVNKYTLLKGEHKALCDRHDEELEASSRIRADLEATHNEKLNSLEEASKLSIEELTKRNKHLELQYNDLEAEYTLKIESLELKLKEIKHQHKQRRDDSASKCENLEEELTKLRQEMKQLQKEYDAVESVQQERVDTLLEDHAKKVAEEKKKFEDLRYEYDTFLEIHLKLEEDAEQAKERYKDSLLKIRNLESEAKASIATAEKTKLEHQKAIEAIEGTHQDAVEKSKMLHKQELKKMEGTIMQWRGKFTNLKRDHLSAIKAHNEATQKFIAEIKQIKKDHGMVMAKQGRMRQSAAAKYQKLRRDFDTALVEYGKREAITVHKFEESKREYESKIIDYQNKINELEELLPLAEQNALKEKFDTIESESNKKVTESKEKLERLMETNENLNQQSAKYERELEKSKQCQEKVEADYQDLAASYQASLLKIESLIQQREEKTISVIVMEETKELMEGNGGMVTQHIEQLENETKEESSKPENETQEISREPKSLNGDHHIHSPAERSPEMTTFESGSFQRDFGMIITKLGADSSHGESNLEPNLESSSVVSSAGSSAAGSAIFEAIYKRVEEHAQKLEATTKIESTVPEKTTAHAFKATDFYYVLHHFVELSGVNSCFKKLPQFQALVEEDQNSEVLTAELNDVGSVTETISNILLHRKRFEGVQSSLLHQINMTQLDELYPSTLIELFPSEYGDIGDSISPLDMGYSSSNLNPSNKLETRRMYEEESSETVRLQREKFRKQLYMNTEEIRSKTREKEMRLLNLKYQNLREEFQEIKSGKMAPADDGSFNANSLVVSSNNAPSMNRMKQIESFQKKVLHAELKAKYTKREWEQHKSKLHSCRKQINNGFEESTDKTIGVEKNELVQDHVDRDANQVGKVSWGLDDDDQNNSTLSDEDQFSFHVAKTSSTCTSDDSEDYTSNGESRPVSTASLEAQDGKPDSFGSITKGTKETAEETDYTSACDEDGDDDSSDNSEHMRAGNSVDDDGSGSKNPSDEHPKQKIEAIQLELQQARQAAEAARRKQLEREQNLKDVIFHYKRLQKQHEEALDEKQQPRKWKNTKVVSTTNLERDLQQAHANVSAVKRELKEACEQHCEEKGHLRDVMGQFQNLQADFLRVLAEKQELENAVYQRPGLVPGVVPASIITGPQPRFLDSSGSWVASTIGGPSFGGMSTESNPTNQRPTPDALPLIKVVGPPQRSQNNPAPYMVQNNQYVSPGKVVELGDRDRISPNRPIRAQAHTHSSQTSQRTQTRHPGQNSNHTRTSAFTIHSGTSMRGVQHQQNLQQQRQQQIQQQRHQLQNKFQQQNPGEKQLRGALSTTKPVSKKKRGIFRGWKKQ